MPDENQTEFMLDGKKWKVLAIKPCPKIPIEPQTVKMRFEIECEVSLNETIEPHQHIVAEVENSEYEDDLDKILNGELREFPVAAYCGGKMSLSPIFSIVSQDVIRDFSELPRNLRVAETFLKMYADYIEKHLPNELKDVFFKLWEESNLQYSGDREKTISYLAQAEAKAVRKRLTFGKYKRDDSNLTQEREKFLQNCFQYLALLVTEKRRNRDKRRIFQIDLAKKMFPKNLVTSETLFRRELMRFKITFADVLNEFEKKDKIPD